MILDRLQELFVLHRGLDPNDEDSSADEQAEKLLFFYSKTSGDVNEKVQIVTAIEGLMELAKTFSNKPIESVVMRDKLWIFYPCEPKIWFVASIMNDFTIAQDKPNNMDLLDSQGISSFLKSMYELFFAMHGPIQAYLEGENGNGWESILSVIKYRKLTRKTQFKIGNARNDYEKLQEEEREGIIREGMQELMALSVSTLQELEETFTNASESLNQSLASAYYRLPEFKKRFQSYIMWYLSLEDLNYISCFPALRTSSSCSTTALVAGRGHLKNTAGSIYQMIFRMKTALSREFLSPNQQSISLMVSYRHRLLWTDFDAEVTLHLQNLLLRWEMTFLPHLCNRSLYQAMDDFTQSLYHHHTAGETAAAMISGGGGSGGAGGGGGSANSSGGGAAGGSSFSRCEYTSLENEQKLRLALSLQELEEKRQRRNGLLTNDGKYLSLDKYTIPLQTTAAYYAATAISQQQQRRRSARRSTSNISNATSNLMTAENIATSRTFLDTIDLADHQSILFPSIYSQRLYKAAIATTAGEKKKKGSSSNNTAQYCLGRVFFVSLGNLVIGVVLPEEKIKGLLAKEMTLLLEEALALAVAQQEEQQLQSKMAAAAEGTTAAAADAPSSTMPTIPPNSATMEQVEAKDKNDDDDDGYSSSRSISPKQIRPIAILPIPLPAATITPLSPLMAAFSINFLSSNSGGIRISKLVEKIKQIKLQQQQQHNPQATTVADKPSSSSSSSSSGIHPQDLFKLQVIYLAKRLHTIFQEEQQTRTSYLDELFQPRSFAPMQRPSTSSSSNPAAAASMAAGSSSNSGKQLRPNSTASSNAAAVNASSFLYHQYGSTMINHNTLKGFLQYRPLLHYSLLDRDNSNNSNNSNNNSTNGGGNNTGSNSGSGTKAFCFSPAFSGIKFFGNELDSAMIQLDAHLASSMTAGVRNNGSYTNNPATSWMSTPISLSTCDLWLDRYLCSLSRFGEQSSLFLQLFVEKFGFGVVRALMDVYAHMTASGGTNSNGKENGDGMKLAARLHALSSSMQHGGKPSQSATNGMMCLRVSTTQRGGLWVVGRKIINNQPLLVVVTNCATYDDVMEVVEQIVKEIQQS